MKIIGIDGNEANTHMRVGVNMYAFELLCSIYQLRNEWEDKFKVIVYLKDKPLDDMPVANESWEYKVLPGRGMWILTKLMPSLWFDTPRPSLFFSPSHYIPPLTPIPRICSIMDLGYLEFSGQFRKMDFWQLKWWTAYSILASKHIFTISLSSKDDIVRHYPSARDSVSLTPLGFDHNRFNTTISDTRKVGVTKRYAIVRPYILFLSTLKPSKNVIGLIEAWGKIVDEFPQYSLVVAGKRGWLYDEIFAKARALGLRGKVVFTDYVKEEDKPALIAGAKVFVLPSFWEGFGLDALSAMACGVPVVTSNQGSLPEVVGGAGVQVNPYNIDSIAAGIKKILTLDKKDYNSLVKKGLTQAEKFSWEKTARGTLKTLERELFK